MLDNKDTSDLSNSNNLCMGCMRPRGISEKCEECGWEEGSQPNSPLYLPPRLELNNRYVMGRMLGHGGFGITYIAWDKELQIKVAIKEYLPEGLGTRAQGEKTVSVYSGQNGEDFEYGLEKFLAEARTLARFQSNANIISIINFFKENGTAYIVMEYVEGISLKQHLQYLKAGRMPLDEALTFVMPVVDALSIVHAEGILHRDISPDNIYVTKDYHVKLLDFGASRKAVSGANKSLSVLIKQGFAPIEQYSTRGLQGPWTDVYALAATLYKLITGIIPPESIDRMQGAELVTLASLGVEMPEGVETVLIKALSIQPQERYQSIEEFKTELNKAILFENIKKKMQGNINDQNVLTGNKDNLSENILNTKSESNSEFANRINLFWIQDVLTSLPSLVGVFLTWWASQRPFHVDELFAFVPFLCIFGLVANLFLWYKFTSKNKIKYFKSNSFKYLYKLILTTLFFSALMECFFVADYNFLNFSDAYNDINMAYHSKIYTGSGLLKILTLEIFACIIPVIINYCIINRASKSYQSTQNKR